MFPAVSHDDEYQLDPEEYKELQLQLLKRRRWELRQHFHPFELNEESFSKAYRYFILFPIFNTFYISGPMEILTNPIFIRLKKMQVRMLIQKLDDKGRLQGNKTIAGISIETQVLITLSFYARGCYQHCVAQNWYHPVETSTACVIIDRVTDALVSLADEFIVFPKTQQQRRQVHQR